MTVVFRLLEQDDGLRERLVLLAQEHDPELFHDFAVARVAVYCERWLRVGGNTVP